MDTLYIVAKIIVSIVFFLTAFVMVYLCFKAKHLKEEFARVEKLCVEDLKKIYDTGSVVSKVLIELVLARYSLDLNKFVK